MTKEQKRIVACWERYEADMPDASTEALAYLVSDEMGARLDKIIGALLARNKSLAKDRNNA